MPIAIKLPDMGTNVEECKVLAWKVKPNDAVKRGDVLADIETDKAVAELESTAEGVVLQLRVPAGATARMGEILAYVGQAGEAIAAETVDAAGIDACGDLKSPAPDDRPAGATPTQVRLPSSPEEGSLAGSPAEAGREAPTATGWSQATADPARVSPIVRNLAAKLGVDLGKLSGTGVGGVITREDVQYAHRFPAPPQRTHASPSGPLSRSQAAVARAVEKSWREIPHLTVSASIYMNRAIQLRAETQARGSKISYDAIFLKALAAVGARHPLFFARLEGERIVPSQGIDIALAVSFGDELHLPVIREIDRKSLAALQAEIAEVAGAVKAHALKAHQLGGATMALSNLGMFPIDSFDAIIFPGHSSILTVGAVQMVSCVRDGHLAISPRVTVKLAADHRLINGRAAAEFLTEVKNVVETASLT